MAKVEADPIIVRDWDCIRFYGRVRAMEAEGFTPRLESYTVMPDLDPETGELANLYLIEMEVPEAA